MAFIWVSVDLQCILSGKYISLNRSHDILAITQNLHKNGYMRNVNNIISFIFLELTYDRYFMSTFYLVLPSYKLAKLYI